MDFFSNISNFFSTGKKEESQEKCMEECKNKPKKSMVAEELKQEPVPDATPPPDQPNQMGGKRYRKKRSSNKKQGLKKKRATKHRKTARK